MLVRDLMHRELVSILPHVSVDDAYTLMRAHHFHHFPVVDEQGHLQGIISDRDLLADMHRRLHTGWKGSQVRDIVTHKLITARPDDTVQQAAALMVQHRISSLPVLESGQLIGILTQLDVLRWVADHTAP